jgi:parallel beta-helix repeat protein
MIASNGLAAMPYDSRYPGSVYVWRASFPHVNNCIISGNANGGLFFSESYAEIANCTVIYNTRTNGVYGDRLFGLLNSIVYSNNANGTQIGYKAGEQAPVVTYCDVQGGWSGQGNITNEPVLCPMNQALMPGSRGIDEGRPDSVYFDSCIDPVGPCTPYPRGTERNDMGAFGGPGACDGVGNTLVPVECYVAPRIVTQPGNLTICQGNPATFTVGVSGTPPLSYQWYFNASPVQTNGTNASLTFPSAQHSNEGSYHVVVTNAYGSATSSNASLTVLDGCTPEIVAQPQYRYGCIGHSATFTVSAIGMLPLTYQWYFRTNTLGGSITNGTAANLTLTNLQHSNAGPYLVVVSNRSGSVTSSVAWLDVFDATVEIQVRNYFGFPYAGLNVLGQLGSNCELRYTTDLGKTNFADWTPLEKKAMTNSSWFYFDMESGWSPRRFYGVKQVP